MVLLNPNTKARRLGYLKLLVHFFQLNDGKYNAHKLNRDFSEFAFEYRSHLKKGAYQSGDVIGSPKSAKPYTKLAIEMGIIAKCKKEYLITGDLASFCLEVQDNPFRISPIERLKFISIILSHDRYLFLQLLKTINEYSGNLVYREFGEMFLEKTEFDLLGKVGPTSEKLLEIDALFDYLVKGHEKPIYLDDRVFPRVHWMADLELISLKENQNQPFVVKLTKMGQTLLEQKLIP